MIIFICTLIRAGWMIIFICTLIRANLVQILQDFAYKILALNNLPISCALLRFFSTNFHPSLSIDAVRLSAKQVLLLELRNAGVFTFKKLNVQRIVVG